MGYSITTINNTRIALNKFVEYCNTMNIQCITNDQIFKYLKNEFDIDYFNPKNSKETVTRRPFIMLIEFYEDGNFKKTHQKKSNIIVPLMYEEVFEKYSLFITEKDLNNKTQNNKLRTVKKLFCYLSSKKIYKLEDIEIINVITYINSLSFMKISTLKTIKTHIRELFNWLYEERISNINGNMIFPVIRKVPSTEILSYYTKEEIKQILETIDNTTKNGKRDYAIICLLSFYGIRIGDIIDMKLTDIDWNHNYIRIIQKKTNNLLTVPLLEEVKFALLDYIKNARIEKNVDNEYVFLTLNAPYTKLNSNCAYKQIKKYMDFAKIDYKNKHHGPHAFRHSLATNLMKENVPLSAISSVLGHSNVKTTEVYLTVDEKNLKELSLEVPKYEL